MPPASWLLARPARLTTRQFSARQGSATGATPSQKATSHEQWHEGRAVVQDLHAKPYPRQARSHDSAAWPQTTLNYRTLRKRTDNPAEAMHSANSERSCMIKMFGQEARSARPSARAARRPVPWTLPARHGRPQIRADLLAPTPWLRKLNENPTIEDAFGKNCLEYLDWACSLIGFD